MQAGMVPVRSLSLKLLKSVQAGDMAKCFVGYAAMFLGLEEQHGQQFC